MRAARRGVGADRSFWLAVNCPSFSTENPTSQGTFQSQAKQGIWSSSLDSLVGSGPG